MANNSAQRIEKWSHKASKDEVILKSNKIN